MVQMSTRQNTIPQDGYSPASERVFEPGARPVAKRPTANHAELKALFQLQMATGRPGNPFRLDESRHGLAINWAVLAAPPSDR
jgi:hypothetical protein